MSIYKNSKSQMTTIRIPHEVMEGIESLKQDGESTAGFLVTAARREIARRQLEQNGGDVLNNLNGALDTLARIESTSAKIIEDAQQVAQAARQQLQQLRPSGEAEPAEPVRQKTAKAADPSLAPPVDPRAEEKPV